MENLLEEISKRVHLSSNEEKYQNLCLHTSEVTGGKEFLDNSKKAKMLLIKINNNTNPRLDYTAQYHHLIQAMTEWLNKNDWAVE